MIKIRLIAFGCKNGHMRGLLFSLQENVTRILKLSEPSIIKIGYYDITKIYKKRYV